MHVDGTLKFRPTSILKERFTGACLGLNPEFNVDGFWFDDCTFMATVGSANGRSFVPSNTYTGRLNKATKELVVETSNVEGVNRNFLSLIPDVYGTINARLDYFGPCDAFCEEGCPI